MRVGIESIHAYCGQTSLDIRRLFEARGLDLERFGNLMMQEKSVNVPCEDPVTNAVNAAKPILDKLAPEAKNRIEMVITASESGLDFGKSLSTYIHAALGLSRHCRLFEIKQACYGGTAALQMAINFIASQVSPGAKVLVIATDVARAAAKMTYAEPSQGVAAVAMLVSDNPEIFECDLGANGYYGYEVMDTCRPEPEIETGDPDLSLMSYLDCLEGSYEAYINKVEGADLQGTFSHLVFHTPFGGMVKGAHRKLMRKYKPMNPQAIEDDFNSRVMPSLSYAARVGNVYSASIYLALCGLIDTIDLTHAKRIGLYSYGSGCSSEFYSGIIHPTAKAKLQTLAIKQAIDNRYPLTIENYDRLLDLNMEWLFGIKDKTVDINTFADIYARQFAGKGLLVLKCINNYHREYAWS
jgi:polyketide biosynthesis 3-hydroxy-3-methylglutaryl-CoA synthase-like enzyme PksG